MKHLLFCAIVFAFSVTCAAQVGGGVNLHYKAISGVGFIGANAHVDWQKEFNKGYTFTVDFNLPYTSTSSYEAEAINPFAQPQTVTLEQEYKVGLFGFAADWRRYFGQGEWTDGGLYGSMGTGLFFFTEQYTNPAVPSGYESTVSERDNFFLISQFYGRLQLGYEIEIGGPMLSLEAGIHLPATSTTADPYADVYETVAPGFFQFSAGIRM